MFFDLDKDDETTQPKVNLIGKEDSLFDMVLFIDRASKSIVMTLFGSKNNEDLIIYKPEAN